MTIINNGECRRNPNIQNMEIKFRRAVHCIYMIYISVDHSKVSDSGLQAPVGGSSKDLSSV